MGYNDGFTFAVDNPFGAAEPGSVVLFEHGSLFSLRGNVTLSLSGRTYSNFEVKYTNGIFQVFWLQLLFYR